MGKKELYVVGAVIMMAIFSVIFSPSPITAGSLQPSAAPAPTMKTLDEIPPTWDQSLECDSTACPRFQLVLGGAGVLDKETGLVWEQAVDSSAMSWASAQQYCASRVVGGRLGWHVPTVEQLASLMTPTATVAPYLPTGNPFTGVQSSYYWTATTLAGSTTNAWGVNFYTNSVAYGNKSDGFNAWCVRGGQSYDGQ